MFFFFCLWRSYVVATDQKRDFNLSWNQNLDDLLVSTFPQKETCLSSKPQSNDKKMQQVGLLIDYFLLFLSLLNCYHYYYYYFLFIFFIFFTECLTSDHEVAGSIPGTSTNFKCGLGLERGLPSPVRTTG